MNEILKNLLNEHRRTGRLLDLLEKQLGQRDRIGTTELVQLKQLIRYFGLYRELVHHKKEDLIFEFLQARFPDAACMVNDLRAEHRLLRDLMERFADLLDYVDTKGEYDNRLLMQAVEEFISVSRNHMIREELNMFSLARERFSDQDWQDVARAISCKIETVKIQKLAKQSGQLYQDIIAFDSLFGSNSDAVPH